MSSISLTGVINLTISQVNCCHVAGGRKRNETALSVTLITISLHLTALGEMCWSASSVWPITTDTFPSIPINVLPDRHCWGFLKSKLNYSQSLDRWENLFLFFIYLYIYLLEIVSPLEYINRDQEMWLLDVSQSHTLISSRCQKPRLTLTNAVYQSVCNLYILVENRTKQTIYLDKQDPLFI